MDETDTVIEHYLNIRFGYQCRIYTITLFKHVSTTNIAYQRPKRIFGESTDYR